MNALTIIALFFALLCAIAFGLAVFVSARDEMRARARAEAADERDWQTPIVILEAQAVRRRAIVDLHLSEWRRTS